MKSIITLLTLILTGCSTTTGDAAKDQRHRIANQLMIEAGRVLGQVALSTLGNVAKAELQGTDVNFGHSLADAAWSSTGSINSGTLERIMIAATNGQVPATVAIATKEFDAAVARGVPPAKAAYAIGDVISSTTLKL